MKNILNKTIISKFRTFDDVYYDDILLYKCVLNYLDDDRSLNHMLAIVNLQYKVKL